jgi:hypothetical protein
MDFLTRIPRGLLLLLGCAGCASAEPPTDLHFEFAVTKTPAVYHIGERIVCKMSFSTSAPGKYGIDTSGGPRGIWGHSFETFQAIPKDGTVDPRVDLSRQLGFVIAGDVLQGYLKLSSKPHVETTDLNQWLRFVRPGVYHLRAQSSRASLFREQPSPAAANEVVVNSNEIVVTVLPADPAWTANELSDIKKLLDSPASSADQKAVAASRLRYLNTESSTVEMVLELPGTAGAPYHHDLYEGLIESSRRKTAIGMLQQTIQGAASRVSWDAVELLSKLTLLDEYRNRPIPPFDGKDPGQLKALRAAVQERQDRHVAVMAQYSAELKASLPRRTGRARTDAIFALWKEQELHSQGSATESLESMRREVISIAGDLTPDQQWWILSVYWDRLSNRQSLLPLIKKLVFSGQPIQLNNLAGGDLRQTAVERYCELDAAGCQGR